MIAAAPQPLHYWEEVVHCEVILSPDLETSIQPEIPQLTAMRSWFSSVPVQIREIMGALKFAQ